MSYAAPDQAAASVSSAADGPTSGAATRRRLPLRVSLLPPLTFAVGVIAIWWISAAWWESTVFPTPAESMVTLGDNLARPDFQASVVDTVSLLAVSYAMAAVVGCLLGFCVGLLPFWRDAFSPLLYAVYSIPKVTLYPLFLLILGIGDISRIGFAFAHGVLPITLIVMGATASVERIQLKLAASLGMRTLPVIRKILLPSVLPAVTTALRLGFGLTFIGLILAEMFSGSSGLGHELLRNVTLARMEDILGGVILVALIAVVPTTLLQVIERRVHARYEG